MFLIWKGDLQGMGIIACYMEKKMMLDRIKGLEKVIKSSDVAKKVRVKLHWCTQPAFETSSKINYWNQRSY